MIRAAVIILLPICFLLPEGNSFGVSGQERIENGLCSIFFEYDGWKETTYVGRKEAIEGYGFLLSNEGIFEHTQQLDSGKEVLHKGRAPKEIQALKIDFKLGYNDKIGWKGYEEVLLSISVTNSNSGKFLAGPWIASTFRNKESRRENRSPEGMPALDGSIDIKGKLLKISSRCSVTLK